MDSWTEYRRQIDRLLDEHRPARANAGDKDWREPVYGWARNHIPDESNLVRHFAERSVDGREGQATKRGNRVLRLWLHGQTPLEWKICGPLPIVANRVRVRLDAAIPDEVEDAATELRHRGKLTYDEILLLSEGLQRLARLARRAGLAKVSLIGDLPPDGDGEQSAGDLFDDDEDDPWS